MNKALVVLLFLASLSFSSFAQVKPVKYNTEYKVIFSANYGLHYDSYFAQSKSSDVVSGVLRVITPGNVIIGLMWDNVQPVIGHCYGLQGGYSIPKSDQFFIDLQARIFNNKLLGLGFGLRPEFRYDFEWFSMQVGPDLNFNNGSVRIGAVGGFSISFMLK